MRCVPVDYRVFDKDRDGKTKNDHFAEMLLRLSSAVLILQLVCFDSWYGSIENLKLVRSFGWHFLTRLKANRQIRRQSGGILQAVSEAGLCGGDGTIVLAQRFRRNQSIPGSRYRRHIGILGDESSSR